MSQLPDGCGRADREQHGKYDTEMRDRQDLLLVSSDQHTGQSVSQSHEDGITKLVAFTDTQMRQDHITGHQERSGIYSILKDLELIQQEHYEQRIKKGSEEPQVLREGREVVKQEVHERLGLKAGLKVRHGMTQLI